jgi:tetratricopeptide (TPR) repeat protein
MRSILKPTIGMGLGAGLAIASMWCINQLPSDSSRPEPQSMYSLAAIKAEPTFDLSETNGRIQSTEAPSLLASAISRPDDSDFLPNIPDSLSFHSEFQQFEHLKSCEADFMDAKSTNSIMAGGPQAGQANHPESLTLARPARLPLDNSEDSRLVAEAPAKPQITPGRPQTTSGFQSNAHFKPNSDSAPRPILKSTSSPTVSTAIDTRHDLQQDLQEAGEVKKEEIQINFDEVRLHRPQPLKQLVETPQHFLTSLSATSNGNTTLRMNEAVAVRAVHHIEYGKTLARRGAKASAKQEFMAALSVIAQDFDAQASSTEFSQALMHGLRALKESEEFVLSDSEAQIGMDISGWVESHQSGALTKEQAKNFTPIQALQRYYGFAQIQIERAVGKNVVSAEALFCLGRLYTLGDSSEVIDGKLDRAKAMVFHRASLACDPRNYRSANELGVLLAEFGELQDSVELLKHSLRLHQTPKAWENLAKLHDRLSQPQLANAARSEYQRLLASQNSGMIHWLESNQFNSTAMPEGILASTMATGRNEKPVPNQDSKQPSGSSEEKKSLSDRMKSWF